MSNRLYPVLAVWLLTATAFIPAADEGRPNVLLITIDTLTADHLGVYGYSQIETPNIDKLASEAMIFEKAISPVPLTLPSHASILTGVYPLYHGIRDNAGFVLGAQHLTLAEILKEQGYATGAFVGSFILDSRFGLDQGFDTYFADFELTGLDTIAPGLIQRPAGEVAEEAMEWITAQKSEKQPFFCWAHFYDPHAPYEPPEPFATRYSSSLYDGEIAYVDQVIGNFLDSLKNQGLYEKTVIIVTSDHGESLGEHVEKTHGYFIYESTQLVPLVWKSPDKRYRPGRAAVTVRLIDIAPTILQQLGIRAPAVMQGTGLVRELLGRPGPVLQAYAESFYPRLQFGWSELRSLYRFPYKYIEAPRPELYNLETDPNEKFNLIKSRQSIANSLREQLMELIERYSPSTEVEQVEMDAETAAALASLGYITLSAGTSVGDNSYQDLPDPKDKVSIYVETTETYSLIRKGKYPEAIRSFEKILREDPTATFVYHSMGTAYSKMGRDKEAVEAFLKAAEAFPSDAMLFFNMGSSYLRLADWENAEKSFDKTLELDPAHFRARGNLASLWLQQSRFEEALDASLKILKKHPTYEVALFDAGVASAALEKPKVAIEYLEKARQVNPQNPRTYQYLAQLYDGIGDSEKASEYLAKAKALSAKPR